MGPIINLRVCISSYLLTILDIIYYIYTYTHDLKLLHAVIILFINCYTGTYVVITAEAIMYNLKVPKANVEIHFN